MGQIRVAQGRLEDGLELLIQALENLKVTLGDSHWQTADNCYVVARQLMLVGRDNEARYVLCALCSCCPTKPDIT